MDQFSDDSFSDEEGDTLLSVGNNYIIKKTQQKMNINKTFLVAV
jgi:hypothetical protein